jgi:hypothetical protein
MFHTTHHEAAPLVNALVYLMRWLYMQRLPFDMETSLQLDQMEIQLQVGGVTSVLCGRGIVLI